MKYAPSVLDKIVAGLVVLIITIAVSGSKFGRWHSSNKHLSILPVYMADTDPTSAVYHSLKSKKESSSHSGKELAGCGDKRLFNRESPRINTNRIFLTFGCSAPAYRLRRNRTLSWKMLGKNPRAGFSIVSLFFDYTKKSLRREKPAWKWAKRNREQTEGLRTGFLQIYSIIISAEWGVQQKNPHAGFSDSIFQERVRFLRRR